MKRTIQLFLALAATASALVGAFVVEPPPARASSPELGSMSLPIGPTPTPATGDLLCNLSTGDVADIIDHYDLDPDTERLADALETPFNCGAYGELCSALDNTHAHAFACGAWLDLKNHWSVTDVIARSFDRLVDWSSSQEEDTGDCAELCGDREVLRCSSIYINGQWRTIALCDMYINFEDAHFLGPILDRLEEL